MSLSTVFIIAVVALIFYFGVRHGVRVGKGEESCCSGGGSGSDVKKFKKAHITDKDESHYPYHADLTIAGMICNNCVDKVTNALDSIDGTWATVTLDDRNAHVRSVNPIDEDALREVVGEAGYRVIGYKAA